MKKFTKVCLAVALITFLTGCLCGCYARRAPTDGARQCGTADGDSVSVCT